MSRKNLHQQLFLIQRRMAGALQQQAEKLSKKGKLLALVVFCAISSVLSIYLFTGGLFIGKSSTTGVFDVRSSKLPGLNNHKPGGLPELGRSSDLKNNNDSLVQQKYQSISNQTVMGQKTYSVKFQRQRKFFIVLPLLVLPFTTLMFWALGGGQTGLVNENPLQGFNLKLPDAMLKDSEELNKLSYYEKAASDSLQLQKLRKSDPYFRSPQDESLIEDAYDSEAYLGGTTGRKPNSKHTDPNEEKVYRKLAELDKAMNQQTTSPAQKTFEIASETQGESADKEEMAKLEQMMLAMNQSPGRDPEMDQIDQMLEKVLDIQYPERVVERIRQNSEANQGQVFPVSVDMSRSPVSLLESTEPGVIPTKKFGSGQASFHSINNQVDLNNQNAVNAVIHESQTLVSGSTVKLRLADNVYINGLLVPENNFVYGIAELTGERLLVDINSITHEGTLFPVDLSVFDVDGLEGIQVPGAIARDVAKQSASSSMQGINITTLDPSIGAQAASAGIEAAKSLFGKKVKQVKVTVKAGYKVLLFDQRQHRGT